MPNRLVTETSPYLLQHAENPVDWYPWGEEAFEKAREEGKPVLLSVGYSTCHWCHVMAHESFESSDIAGLMNEHFVNIKVDREERPDIDGVYMTAVQALTGQGGWPMTLFLTPDKKPFFAGTYFPPDDAHGRPGFPRLLQTISSTWHERREDILGSANSISEQLAEASQRVASREPFDAKVLDGATEAMLHSSDDIWGGFGTAPKFPSPANLEFLLLRAADPNRPDHVRLRAMLERTLWGMSSGGMYDQLGGGFARYSVDVQWLVPHFEKMLYDNAGLARVYLHAFQLFGDPEHERIVRETLAYLEREMLGNEGGFYSAQDADSEGVEGKFFLWTVEQVAELLGDDADAFNRIYGVTREGNFYDPHNPELQGRNVLSRRSEPFPGATGMDPDAFEARIDGWRDLLLEARSKRIAPETDDKALASWNGLTLAVFSEAARVFGDAHLRGIAEHNARFIRERMWSNGILLHTYKGGVARIEGMLEDYAYCGIGLIELYKLTGERDHLDWANDLLDVVVERFTDTEGGGFFETPSGSEELLFRQKSRFDQATPCASSSTALLALMLQRYGLRTDGEAIAKDVVAGVQALILDATTGFGSTLQVMELLASSPRELAIVGEASVRESFERATAARFLPGLAIAPASAPNGLAVLEGREAPEGGAIAWLCENMICNLPVTNAEELSNQLTEMFPPIPEKPVEKAHG
ncbi:MAG: thioredoxin domain-containing protein [Dehalococcoidia bacterium]|nr:thioredoxin domain-containing protein [Dehalococcoidia bacterium]